jgi:hypothetical protein
MSREDAWDIALRSSKRLANNDNNDFRDQIADTAVNSYYLDVWMAVFNNDPDMLNRLSQLQQESLYVYK